jgi:hypothetical protein
MWTLSSSMADRLFAISNAVLIIGAAAVLIGTIGSVVIAGVRERFSDERIASNEAETKRAIADSDVAKKGAEEARANAATANERAAMLEREAAQLRLALEAAREETERVHQGVASRHVLLAQRELIRSALSGKHFAISIVTWAGDEPEVVSYRDELASAFSEAGAEVAVDNNVMNPAQVGLLLLDSTVLADSTAAQALSAAGIEFAYRQVKTPSPILRVGVKKPTL